MDEQDCDPLTVAEWVGKFVSHAAISAGASTNPVLSYEQQVGLVISADYRELLTVCDGIEGALGGGYLAIWNIAKRVSSMRGVRHVEAILLGYFLRPTAVRSILASTAAAAGMVESSKWKSRACHPMSQNRVPRHSVSSSSKNSHRRLFSRHVHVTRNDALDFWTKRSSFKIGEQQLKHSGGVR